MSFDPTNPESADQYDFLWVAGKQMPGLVSFPAPGTSPRKWDERNGVGLSGATIVFTGLGVANFTTRLTLISSAEFALWEDVKDLVAPPPQGQRPKIVDVVHPLLQEVGIRAAGVEDRVMFQPEDETGSWFVDIKWKGYRKPLPQIGTGDASKSAANGTTAKDAGDEQIQALLKQLQGLQ